VREDIPAWAMGFTPLAERLYADSLFLTKVRSPSLAIEHRPRRPSEPNGSTAT
jgi:hypothetical protein